MLAAKKPSTKKQNPQKDSDSGESSTSGDEEAAGAASSAAAPKKKDLQTEKALEDAQQKLAKTALAPEPHLYEFPSAQAAKTHELPLQQYVHDRFFRIGKGPKQGSSSEKIHAQLVKLAKAQAIRNNETNCLLHKDNSRKWTPDAEKVVNFYLDSSRIIKLDSYSARSVIIALAHFLNTNGYIPTAIFVIGNTHILCISNPTEKQPGNIQLQTLSASGDKTYTTSTYGTGIPAELGKHPTSIFQTMRDYSVKIASLGKNSNESNFLNLLNFLQTVMEVARYLYRSDDKDTLDGLPIGIAQQRTSKLLTDGKITVQDAYGLDDKGKFYDKKKMVGTYSGPTPEHLVHNAPYGAVTGKGLKDHVPVVKEKVLRINDKYNSSYHPSTADAYRIAGARQHRVELARGFGSGAESEGNDYSDAEAPKLPPQANSIQIT